MCNAPTYICTRYANACSYICTANSHIIAKYGKLYPIYQYNINGMLLCIWITFHMGVFRDVRMYKICLHMWLHTYIRTYMEDSHICCNTLFTYLVVDHLQCVPCVCMCMLSDPDKADLSVIASANGTATMNGPKLVQCVTVLPIPNLCGGILYGLLGWLGLAYSLC